MIIIVSVLSILVFILSILFASLVWRFMRKSQKRSKEYKNEKVVINNKSSIEGEIENNLKNNLVEEKSQSVIEQAAQEKSQNKSIAEEVTQENVSTDVERQNTNDFKVEQLKSEEKSNKPVSLRASNVAPLAGGDVIATQLDLARIYFDIGSNREAKKLLRPALEKGTEEQQLSAKKLLEKFNVTT